MRIVLDLVIGLLVFIELIDALFISSLAAQYKKFGRAGQGKVSRRSGDGSLRDMLPDNTTVGLNLGQYRIPYVTFGNRDKHRSERDQQVN